MKLKKIGKVFHAEVQTATGGRTTITTRSTDKREATRIARESGIEELETAAKAGRLTNEAIGRITSGKKVTMLSTLSEWEKWMETIGKAPMTILNSTTTVKKWVREMNLEGTSPAAITEQHINKWINNPDGDAKYRTRAVNLASIRSYFAFAHAKGWCVGDPSKLVRVRMDILSHEQKEAAEKVPFTDAEIRALISDLSNRLETNPHKIQAEHKESGLNIDLKRAGEIAAANAERNAINIFWEFAVRISNEIGLRLGDICQLEWDCFIKPGRVTVWTDKRDKRVSVPVSDEILDLTTEIPVSDSKFLFPYQRDLARDPKRKTTLSMQFKRITQRVEVDGSGKSFHSLRHGCISRWHKNGKSLEEIGKDVGHSDTKTTVGYLH